MDRLKFHPHKKESRDDCDVRRFTQEKLPDIDASFRSTAAISSNWLEKQKQPGTIVNDIAWSQATREAEIQRRTVDFKQVLGKFVQASPNSATKGFDIRAKHTWDEVLDEVQTAKEAYDAKGTKAAGIGGRIRGAGRALEENSEALTASSDGWLSLLPSGEYTSVVCGGLKLMFSAAKNQSGVRTSIMDALGSLPDEIEEADAYVTLYRELSVSQKQLGFKFHKKLADAATELYLAILIAIEYMLEWLDHNVFKHLFKAFFEQANYGKMVKAKIEDVQSSAKTLHSCAERCHYYVNVETKAIAQATMEENREGFTNVEEKMNGIMKLLTEQQRSSEWIKHTMEGKIAQQDRRIQEMNEELQRARAPVPIAIAPEVLVSLLQIDLEVTRRGLKSATSLGLNSNPTYQDQAKWILLNSRWRAWFNSASSGLLLIKSQDLTSVVTPLSLFSSMVVKSLYDVEPAIPLYYFCGLPQHSAPSGPSHLLRSLIAQLMTLRASDTSPFSNDHVQQISRWEPNHLFFLFRTLIASLPSSTVFIVIDGSRRYHEPAEIYFLVQGLNQLAQGGTGHAIVKVLLTGPVPTDLWQYVAKGDTMTLPLTVEADGMGLNAGMVRGFVSPGMKRRGTRDDIFLRM